MAEPLKNHFGVGVPGRIAGMIAGASPVFPADAFVGDALQGYESLNLVARAGAIARALRRHLPQDYATAIELLLASLGPKLEKTEDFGMAPFLYLPHVLFVAEYGIDHFEPSMRAQYELTQRYSAEFSIRRFLERHQRATLARLRDWAEDPSAHVRRLVSEGTRPRLPWAPRLRAFQKDPRPVLSLLELLKDDPSLYVRRSVANNLNDIGKDHPSVLVDTARRWLKNATEERRWLVHHALRSSVKRADPDALAVLGYGHEARVSIGRIRITPKRAVIGGSMVIDFDLTNTAARRQRVLVDLRIHFVKANGRCSPKVFKLKAIDLAAREGVRIHKTVSLAEMTTRKHYPGRHQVEVILNGNARPLGVFNLLGDGSR